MGETSIQWTDRSINPIRARNKATGAVGHFCEKISPGCGHCYASTWQHRFGTDLDFLPVNRDKVEVFLDESKLQEVLRRRKPTKYFWCDMSDLFAEWVPDEWIDKCFATMALAPHHTHQVLTKRPERMREYLRTVQDDDKDLQRFANAASDLAKSPCAAGIFDEVEWPFPGVWLGVSCEDQQRADERIPHLLRTPAAVRFLSCEPLLSPIDLHAAFYRQRLGPQDPYKRRQLMGVDWVIVGGESGTGARPMDVAWARSIVQQCQAAGVGCFLKQLGARPRSSDPPFCAIDCQCGMHYGLRDKKGGDMSEWPPDLRVRDFPHVEAAHA